MVRGNDISYKDPENYNTIVSRAMQNILQTASLSIIQKDRVQLWQHQPKMVYSTLNGNRVEISIQLNQHNLDKLPERRYYVTNNKRQGFVTIYFLLDINYSTLVNQEIRKQESNSNQQPQHQRVRQTHWQQQQPKFQQSQKRTHPEQTQNHKQTHTHDRKDLLSLGSNRKQQRIDQPQQLTQQNTRTSVSKVDHGPRTMVTLHHRKPIFSRLGPKAEARTESKNPDQQREHYEKAKM